MMTNKKDSVLYMVGGILVGGLVGAGVAMLTAPQSGLKTRSMLKEKGVELKGKITIGAGETRSGWESPGRLTRQGWRGSTQHA
jgi:gas vesicle protein